MAHFFVEDGVLVSSTEIMDAYFYKFAVSSNLYF